MTQFFRARFPGIAILLLLILSISVGGCATPRNDSVFAHQVFTEALAYEALDNYSRSLELYREVVDEFKDTNKSLAARSQIRMARIYKNNLNNPEEAIKAYQTYIKVYPDENNHQEIMLELARLLARENRLEDSIQTYNNFLDRYKESPYRGEVRTNLASLYAKREQYDRAETHYRRFLSNHPNAGRRDAIYIKLSQIYEKTNQHQRKLDVLKKLVENHPDSPHYEDALFQIIRTYSSLNRSEALSKWVERYHEEFPGGKYQSRIDALYNPEGNQSR